MFQPVTVWIASTRNPIRIGKYTAVFVYSPAGGGCIASKRRRIGREADSDGESETEFTSCHSNDQAFAPRNAPKIITSPRLSNQIEEGSGTGLANGSPRRDVKTSTYLLGSNSEENISVERSPATE